MPEGREVVIIETGRLALSLYDVNPNNSIDDCFLVYNKPINTSLRSVKHETLGIIRALSEKY